MPVLQQLTLPDLRDLLDAVAAALGSSADAIDLLAVESAAGEDLTDSVALPAGPGHDMAAVAAEASSALASARTASDAARVLCGIAADSPAAQGFGALMAGLGEMLRNADALDAQRCAIALEIAAEGLRGAGPAVGGAGAVMVSAATGALDALDGGGDLAEVVLRATSDGLVELERGPVEDPGLSERGSADPVAAALLVVLDTVCGIVTGEDLLDAIEAPDDAEPAGATALFRLSCVVEAHPGSDIESADWLVGLWLGLGDVTEFEPKGERWRCAMTTRFPGAAIEAIYEVGRPRQLHIAVVDDGTGDDGDGRR